VRCYLLKGALADGGRARSVRCLGTRPADLGLFAQNLAHDDRVVLEATGNVLAIARIIKTSVHEVVLAHARKVWAICHARVKTGRLDPHAGRSSGS